MFNCLLRLATIFVVIGCKSGQTRENGPYNNYQVVAENVLGEELEYEMNPDSTMVLCLKITPSNEEQHRQSVNYLVINIKDQSIVHQSEIANGEVSWFNPSQLKVRNFLGYPAVDNEGLYIFDLIRKKRITPENFEKE